MSSKPNWCGINSSQENPPGLVIVIPCHDEPDFLTTLNALAACRRPACPVQIRVVVNSPADAAAPLMRRHRSTVQAVQRWMADHTDPSFSLLLHDHPDLPPRWAGVGMARKIGMDAAAHAYRDGGNPSGPIVCLDADCTVADNYLLALVHHFQAHPQTPGCSLYFEHPLEGLSPEHRSAIVAYELYLRYYRQGLRWAGHPTAFHTVGSSMAVRADAYLKQGGMNRRKAGEDFYFLQKIMALGGFTELLDTQVNPSARDSQRVPFGTGRAVAEAMAQKRPDRLTYDPRVFRDLQVLFRQAPRLSTDPPHWEEAPNLRAFWQDACLDTTLQKLRSNAATPASFLKKFYHDFNLFRCLKYIHWATEHCYPRVPLLQACSMVWEWMTEEKTDPHQEAVEWLARFRHRDNPLR